MLAAALALVLALASIGAAVARPTQASAFDATLTATLERSWSWTAPGGCFELAGSGRRVLTIRTSRPVGVSATGGSVPIVGTLMLRGFSTTAVETPGGSCVEETRSCVTGRARLSGSIRVRIAGDLVRLSQLRYRTTGRAGCAPTVAEVRRALAGEPQLESAPAVDGNGLLRNDSKRRIVLSRRSNRSAELTGEVGGNVRALARWSLVLTRR